jgi:hypothetical protein
LGGEDSIKRKRTRDTYAMAVPSPFADLNICFLLVLLLELHYPSSGFCSCNSTISSKTVEK